MATKSKDVTIYFLSENNYLKIGLEYAIQSTNQPLSQLYHINIVYIDSISNLTFNILKTHNKIIVLFDSDFLQFYERFFVVQNMNDAHLYFNSALLCEGAEFKKMHKLYSLLFDCVISKAYTCEQIKNLLKQLLFKATLRHMNVTPYTDIPSEIVNLTPREQAVLKNIFCGKNTKDIARDMFISEKSVLTHRSRIYSKFHVHSLSELYLYIKKGMNLKFL